MADVLAGGSDRRPRRPRRPSRRLVALGSIVVAAALVAVIAVVVWPADNKRAVPRPVSFRCPAASATTRLSPRLAALALPGVGDSIERRAATAPRRWTTVIYGSKGGVGGDTAVVTYPEPRPQRGPSYFSWRVGGRWVVAHGFVSGGPVSYLRRFVHIHDGRPVVSNVVGYRLTVTVPAEPVVTREMRYDGQQFGAAGRVLGGLVFTGVTRTGALDDWTVTAQPPQSGTVGGAPAVVTSIFGGNGALAWEPTAGTVAYIGYSGASLSQTTVAALHCLAAQSRSVSRAQWQPRAVSVSAP